MECSKCPISTPGLVSFDGQQTYDCPFDIPDPCSLTPAAMRLVKMLIEHGISDEDAELVAKAIAGEGRLVFIGKDEITLCIGDEAKFTKGEAAVVIPEYLQDQGGE